MDITSKIIEFELGGLNDAEVVELFAELIRNGMAWSLQGHYGRTASSMIEMNLISKQGVINYDVLDELTSNQ